MQELKKVQKELTKTYLKEQLEYIQVQIHKIQNSVENKRLQLVCQMKLAGGKALQDQN